MKKHFNYIITALFLMEFIIISLLLYLIFHKEEKPIEPIKIEVEILQNQSEFEPVLEIKQIEKIDPYEEYLIKLDEIDKIKSSSEFEWFKAYKELNAEYSEYGEIESIYDVYSTEDIEYLQRMVETECYGTDFESKTHVAAVALSRVESDRFPDTLKAVITRPNQFCYSRKNISEETILACEYAYMIGTEVDGCLWFHSGKKTEKFSGGEYVITDQCGHHFYR